MIMGDFNADNPQWGSDKITDKGSKVEDVISHFNLCMLNDGSNTYLNPGNGSYSSINLSLVDPLLLIDLNWSVHDEACGSDHSPIFLIQIVVLKTTQSKTGILEKPTGLNSKISVLRLFRLKILKIKQILFKTSQKHLQVLLTNEYLRPRRIPKELKNMVFKRVQRSNKSKNKSR